MLLAAVSGSPKPIATIVLMIITCGITWSAWKNPVLASKLIFNIFQIRQNKQYYRLLTSGFLHATEMPRGYFHLGLNMYVFYMFGQKVETALIYGYGNVDGANQVHEYFKGFGQLYGTIIYVGFYLFALTFSSILPLIKNWKNDAYSALGASGGVSAIVFMNIMIQPMGGIGLLFIPVYIVSLAGGIMYLIYSFYAAKRGTDNIGHEAHFAGAIIGIIGLFILVPNGISIFIEALQMWNGKLFMW